VSDVQSSLNSFHGYFNYHFASIDCIAFAETCEKHDVTAWPTFTLYKDGAFVKKFDGPKTLEGLSTFVEETLETIRPGSRSKDGVKLPEVGAHSVDTKAKPDVPAAKDKDAAAGTAAGEKHKTKVAEVEEGNSPVGKEALTATPIAQKPKKPLNAANPLGQSVDLSAEAFQKLVTTTQDPWFIKFYAPWCHHCQAMAPSWLEMGKEMRGLLNVGEVNCDVETRLCKDVRVRGYPTILFFRGGERVEYDGLRGLGDLLSFANKAIDIGDGVKTVDATDFIEMEKKEEVIFLYFYDHATTSEDFAALERLTLSLIGHAKLVKTNSKILAERYKITTWPRLIVSRDGRPTYYNALAPKDMRDFRRVLTWMKSVWQPIVPELTASNSREIMEKKIVVLGILSRERQEDFQSGRRELKEAALEWMEKQSHSSMLERQELRDAKQLRIKEAEDRNDQRALRSAKSIRISSDAVGGPDVGFAWVDGIFWERWIRTTYGIEVRDGEKVIINDEAVSLLLLP
jgi:protein disulfide-isomerase